MKKSAVSQYSVGTPEYVVAHARWQASRGRRPTATYLWERNPLLALVLAMTALKKELSIDDFCRGMYYIVRDSFTREETVARIRGELSYQGVLSVEGGDAYENGLENPEWVDGGRGIGSRQALFDHYSTQGPKNYAGTMLRNGTRVEIYAGERIYALFPTMWPNGSRHTWKVRRADCESCKAIATSNPRDPSRRLPFAPNHVYRCRVCGQRWFVQDAIRGVVWARVMDDLTWKAILRSPYTDLVITGRRPNVLVKFQHAE